MTRTEGLLAGHACDNCGEPMIAHCARHVLPCCPHYPQHEPQREASRTVLGAYLDTADPIDSETAIALLQVELGEAAAAALPEVAGFTCPCGDVFPDAATFHEHVKSSWQD